MVYFMGEKKVCRQDRCLSWGFVTFCAQKVTKKALAVEKSNHFDYLYGGAKKTRRSICSGLRPACYPRLKQFFASSASEASKWRFF